MNSPRFVPVVMRPKYEVLRFDVSDHMTDSRAFMKYATKALAKALIAGGCVKVVKQYDAEAGGVWTAYTVLAGREEMKLP